MITLKIEQLHVHVAEVKVDFPVDEIMQRLARLDGKVNALLFNTGELMGLNQENKDTAARIEDKLDASFAGLSADVQALKNAIPDPNPEVAALLARLEQRADAFAALDAQTDPASLPTGGTTQPPAGGGGGTVDPGGDV